MLARLVKAGHVQPLLQGVYVATGLLLTIEVRAEALALVAPPGAVLTDRAAGWLHGADVLAPGDHRRLPPITMFRRAGDDRLRNRGCDSGQRMFRDEDLMQIGNLVVTTPLRTALDLGRLLPKYQAMGALDALLRTEAHEREELLDNLHRFKGYRGVIQLRALAPLADARAESLAESAMRLHWREAADLPVPTPQVKVYHPFGSEPWRLDLAVEELRYAAEYDGVEFHSSKEDKERDAFRRGWLRDEDGWVIDVLERDDLYGRTANPSRIFRLGLDRARKQLGMPWVRRRTAS
jgi:hypothetical protein